MNARFKKFLIREGFVKQDNKQIVETPMIVSEKFTDFLIREGFMDAMRSLGGKDASAFIYKMKPELDSVPIDTAVIFQAMKRKFTDSALQSYSTEQFKAAAEIVRRGAAKAGPTVKKELEDAADYIDIYSNAASGGKKEEPAAAAPAEKSSSSAGGYDFGSSSDNSCYYCHGGPTNDMWCSDCQQYHCPKCHEFRKGQEDDMEWRNGDLRHTRS